MNPNPFLATFTLTALNVSGFAAAVTGAGPFVIAAANKPADALGHQVTFASVADLHLISLTLVGTDAKGNACTEVIAAGPNNGTVTSVKHYATLTSVTAGATLGANTMNIGWNNDIVSPWYPLNYSVAAFLAAVAAILVSGTATFNIEHTYDLPLSEASVAFADVTGAVANQEFAYNSISVATRLHITAQAAGVLAYRILQGAH